LPLFRSRSRAFAAIADALGFQESDAATTEYENGPVRPTMDVQASLESSVVRYSQFVFSRTDPGGGVIGTASIRPHVLADWDEIASGNVTRVAVAGSEVPPDHDAWVIEVGLQVTSAASFVDASIWRQLDTVVAGSGDTVLWFGDATTRHLSITQAAGITPIILPLPWWIPPVDSQTGAVNLRVEIATGNAITTNVTLGVLSAPRGVLRRLY